VSRKPDERDALLRSPAEFRSGTLGYEFNHARDSHFTFRLRDPAGDVMIRTDVAPDHMTFNDVTGEKREPQESRAHPRARRMALAHGQVRRRQSRGQNQRHEVRLHRQDF
jgi:hypothetical protein